MSQSQGHDREGHRLASPRPRIVVIGGGTGSHTLLTGLKAHPCDITAVVTMSDSGGSSGRLRDDLGQLPPGDVRQCLVALMPDERASILLRSLFNYRFPAGQGLEGHNFGNLFLVALAEITGSMATAIDEAARLLHIRGRVLPVTLTKTTLKARLADGTEIVGEANIDQRRERLEAPIDYVYLEPRAHPYLPVIEALEGADLIVMGPGDLYTSVIPNLLVEDVPQAIQRSRARKVYVCNLMTKPGESDGFKASDFARVVIEYLGGPYLDAMLVNSAPFPDRFVRRYASYGQHPVEVDLEECQRLVPNVIQAPLLHTGVYLRHNSQALAKAIMDIALEVVAA